MIRIGGIYDLGDGTRLQDLDAGCGFCGKRLAEVVLDLSGRWNAGAVICIDCGTLAVLPDPKRARSEGFVLRPSWRGPGLVVACCTSCRYTSSITRRTAAETFARRHVQAMHP